MGSSQSSRWPRPVASTPADWTGANAVDVQTYWNNVLT
jgi:hypothetical protein